MISYNAHKEDNDLKGHIERLSPNVLLVLDNYGLAHDLAVKNPNTQIIFRRYWGRDDVHNFMSPNQFVAEMNALWQQEPNIWFHTGNEAGMSIEMMRWEMALLSSPKGMKFVVGNPSSGSYPDSVVGWRYAHEYIKFLVEHTDKFMLGLHEYFDVTPTITMPNWLSRITNYAGLTRPAYHCGRYLWLTDYCDQYFGGKYPKIVFTECGNDDLTENRDGSDVNNFLLTMIGFKPRGWHTLKDIWQTWYGIQPDITYYNMFNWLVKNVYNHPAVVGLCIFAWTSDDAPNWGKFNVSTAINFQHLNEATRINLGGSKFMYVTSNYTTNVRETPSTNAKIMTRITKMSMVEVDLNLYNGNWYKVYVNGVSGFIRQDAVELSEGRAVYSTASYNVLVRSTPKIMGGNILTDIKPKQIFTLVGEENGWYRVMVNGKIGWSSKMVLTFK